MTQNCTPFDVICLGVTNNDWVHWELANMPMRETMREARDATQRNVKKIVQRGVERLMETRSGWVRLMA